MFCIFDKKGLILNADQKYNYSILFKKKIIYFYISVKQNILGADKNHLNDGLIIEHGTIGFREAACRPNRLLIHPRMAD